LSRERHADAITEVWLIRSRTARPAGAGLSRTSVVAPDCQGPTYVATSLSNRVLAFALTLPAW
jgi:hypothetical protein